MKNLKTVISCNALKTDCPTKECCGCLDLKPDEERDIVEIVCNESGEILGSVTLGELRECITPDLVECQICKETKESDPTPDGDEICPNCGDREMLDN